MSRKALFVTGVFAVIVGVCAAQDAVNADSGHCSKMALSAVWISSIHTTRKASQPSSVTAFLTDGDLRMTMPNEKTRLGTVKAGQTVRENAGSHQPENLSDASFHASRREFKNPEDLRRPDSAMNPC